MTTTRSTSIGSTAKLAVATCLMGLCISLFFALNASAASRENQLLALINSEREKAGVSALTLGDSSLNSAASARAKELTQNYSYERPNGKREFTILGEYNVTDITVGENYLAGPDNAEAVVQSWMNSDYFRARMLDKDAVNVGIAYYNGGQYKHYWVAIFTYPDHSSNSAFAQEVLDLVNSERANCGLAPLAMGDAGLTEAAQIRAEEISINASHTRPCGTSCFTVLEEVNSKLSVASENAAWGSVSPAEVVADWMASDGHRANILDPEVKYMSVGYYYSSSSAYGHNWIQLFAR